MSEESRANNSVDDVYNSDKSTGNCNDTFGGLFEAWKRSGGVAEPIGELRRRGNVIDEPGVRCDYDGGVHERKDGSTKYHLVMTTKEPKDLTDCLEYTITSRERQELLQSVRLNRPIELTDNGELHIFPHGVYKDWIMSIKEIQRRSKQTN